MFYLGTKGSLPGSQKPSRIRNFSFRPCAACALPSELSLLCSVGVCCREPQEKAGSGKGASSVCCRGILGDGEL